MKKKYKKTTKNTRFWLARRLWTSLYPFRNGMKNLDTINILRCKYLRICLKFAMSPHILKSGLQINQEKEYIFLFLEQNFCLNVFVNK